MPTIQEELKAKIMNSPSKTPYFTGWKLDIGASPIKLHEEFKDIPYVRISIRSGIYKVIQTQQVVCEIKGYEIEFKDVVKSIHIFRTINKLLKYFKTNKYLSYEEESGGWFINTEEKING